VEAAVVSKKTMTAAATYYNLRGTNNSDTIYGKGGDDKMYGFGGNDKLYGDR
jgi:Ca2+-binding RTX toxin-like protein